MDTSTCQQEPMRKRDRRLLDAPRLLEFLSRRLKSPWGDRRLFGSSKRSDYSETARLDSMSFGFSGSQSAEG